MTILSTRGAAKKLGISYGTLANYIKVGKLPLPSIAMHGSRVVHLWTEAEIEQLRKLLPKIANGRKTRHQKKQSAKTKAPARVPVPHKQRKVKKKK